MDQQQVKNIANTRYRKLKTLARKISEDFDRETIHKWRVEYKKLRAFLRLIARPPKTADETGISKKLKKAYQISGMIRDLQLQRKRISQAIKGELIKPVGYFKILQKETRELQQELAEILLDNPVDDSRKNANAGIRSKLTANRYRIFAKEKWAVVYEIISSGYFSDDNVHTSRKQLKDLFYDLEIYRGPERRLLAISTRKGMDEKSFNLFLEELGGFQDKCTGIALLKSYWLVNLEKSAREQLEQLKKTWIKEKVRMKQQLIKKLEAIIVRG